MTGLRTPPFEIFIVVIAREGGSELDERQESVTVAVDESDELVDVTRLEMLQTKPLKTCENRSTSDGKGRGTYLPTTRRKSFGLCGSN